MPKLQKSNGAGNQQGQALSYIYGVYFGDGCITRKHFHLKSIDEDFIDYALGRLKLVCPEGTWSKAIYEQGKNAYGKKPIFSLDYRNVEFAESILAITHSGRIVPSLVYESRDNTKAFIEGLLDSDGWVNVNVDEKTVRFQAGVAKTGEFMHDVHKLIVNYGIRCQKMQTMRLKSGKVIKRIRFNPGSFLESDLRFHIARKQKRVDAFRRAQQMLNDLKSASFNDYKRELRAVAQQAIG